MQMKTIEIIFTQMFGSPEYEYEYINAKNLHSSKNYLGRGATGSTILLSSKLDSSFSLPPAPNL